MSVPIEPIVLVQNGRFVVAEVGPRVMLLDRGPTPSDATVRLLAISTLIFGGFGLVSLFTGDGFTARSLATGLGLLAVGVVSFAAMNRTNRALHRAMSTPLQALQPLAVFDRASSAFIDHNGEMIARLPEIHCTATGFGKSQLAVETPAGTRHLAKGNPLTGGLGKLAEVLNQISSGGREL